MPRIAPVLSWNVLSMTVKTPACFCCMVPKRAPTLPVTSTRSRVVVPFSWSRIAPVLAVVFPVMVRAWMVIATLAVLNTNRNPLVSITVSPAPRPTMVTGWVIAGRFEVSSIVPATPIEIVPPPVAFASLIAARRVPAVPSSAVELTVWSAAMAVGAGTTTIQAMAARTAVTAEKVRR